MSVATSSPRVSARVPSRASSGLWLHVLAAGAILRRDAQAFWSYRLRLLTRLLGSIFSLTLFYYISRLVHVSAFQSADAYYAFAVVGLIILTVVNSTLATPPAAARQELVAGTFDRVAIAPFGAVGALVSNLLFPLCLAMVTAAVSLVFAGLAFHLQLRWSTAALAVPLGVVGAVSFMPFGLLLLAATMVSKQAVAGSTWVIAGISLIAGLYFPVYLLPSWIRWMSSVQPFTPTVDLMRHALVGTPLREPWVLSLGKLAGFTTVAMAIALWVLGRALEYGRRHGTLSEY